MTPITLTTPIATSAPDGNTDDNVECVEAAADLVKADDGLEAAEEG